VRSGADVLTRLAGAGGAALSVLLGVLVVQHAGRAVYDLPATAVLLGVGGAVVSAIGWVVVVRSGDLLVLGAAGFALLLVGGVAALLSIGIVLLLMGAALGVVLGQAAGRRRAGGGSLPALAMGVAAAGVGLGLPFAALAASDGPVVRCLRDGVSTSSSIFRTGSGSSSASSSASGSASAEGGQSGTVIQGGRTYRYRCAGTDLVEFEASG
jgi:hypothetical protein